MSGWIKMSLGMEVGLGPGDFVVDGDPVPLKRQKPRFSANVCCGQRLDGLRCQVKMPLGMEVGLSPGDFLLDGDSAPLPRKGE